MVSIKQKGADINESLLFTNVSAVLDDSILAGAAVELQHGVIAGIYLSENEAPTDGITVIDGDGGYLTPGFIDLHNQGGNGFSVMDGSVESLHGMAEFHARYGTTSFLPTPGALRGSEKKVLSAHLEAVDNQPENGAHIPGIHLEGPFLNPKMMGGFSPDFIEEPSVDRYHEFQETSGGNIRMITLAPELDGIGDVILAARKDGVVVSIGHSDGGLDDVLRAIDLGASHVTHMFNAMSPLHHREVGVAGAALYSNELSVQLIADGVHVHPWIMGLLFQSKGIENTCLITDSVSLSGLTDGFYDFYGHRVELRDGQVRTENGTLSGSTLTMSAAVKNLVQINALRIEDAVYMASMSPANVLGISESKGSLEVGKDADVVLMDDRLNVKMTVVSGRVVYDGRE